MVVVLLVAEVALFARLVSRQDEAPAPQVEREAAPLAPSALPRSGSLVTSDVRADGTVAVTQWIRDDDPIEALALALPQGSDGVRAVDARIVAADGVVIADGLDVRREPVPVAVDDPTTLLRVTYLLRGAVERSSTVPGRLLARPVALTADVPDLDGRTVVRVAGATGAGEVLSLACADARSSVDLVRACGAPDGDGWRVRLPREQRDDAVIAQLDVS